MTPCGMMFSGLQRSLPSRLALRWDPPRLLDLVVSEAVHFFEIELPVDCGQPVPCSTAATYTGPALEVLPLQNHLLLILGEFPIPLFEVEAQEFLHFTTQLVVVQD